MNTPQNIHDWTALVESGQPFTYANIGGDGEMLTIQGWGGTNSDGIPSTPEKAEALAKCLLEPRYTLAGYNPGREGSQKLQDAEEWLRRHGVNVPVKHPSYIEDPKYGKAKINVRWVHKEIISSSNVRGEWNGFLKAMGERKWTAISPIGRRATKLGATYWMELGREFGWEQMDAIESRVREGIERHLPDFITFSLGYLTKVLIWRLAPDYPDVTMLDLGACLDPYCGVRNRSGYKKGGWPEAMRKNLEGIG